jgi:hypothetical protein
MKLLNKNLKAQELKIKRKLIQNAVEIYYVIHTYSSFLH